MSITATWWTTAGVSPSSRRAWIEIVCPCRVHRGCDLSPSSRRAWIEICGSPCLLSRPPVALLAEGVDRNFVPNRLLWEHWKVALLAEGVDRNAS